MEPARGELKMRANTEMALAWDSQAQQYARAGASGIRYERHQIPKAWPPHAVSECLLYYDDKGVLRGILNYFPITASVPLGNGWVAEERAGSVNVWVDPARQRRGIASTLLADAVRRWKIDFERQEYTAEGAALVNAFKSKNAAAETR
jgi:GNAT superfamily N-acetyltransferase